MAMNCCALYLQIGRIKQGCQISSDPGKPIAKCCISEDDVSIFWPKKIFKKF